MVQNDHAQFLGLEEGLTEKFLVLDGDAVIGEGGHAGLLQGGEVGEGLPFHACGDRAHRQDVDAGILGLIHHQLYKLGAVGDRLGVAHGHQGGHTAAGGGGAARLHRLLVLKPRFPQMDMHLHQTGGHHKTHGVDDLVRFLRLSRDGGHLAVFNEDISHGIPSGGRINDPPVLNQCFHAEHTFPHNFSI